MKHIIELVDEVRLLRNRLVEVVAELNREVAVTPPQRAVLEFLHRSGTETVPGIARARAVSRQHIQVVVDELQARDLVEPRPNPAHRRSPLMALTTEGARTIENVLDGEARFMSERLADLDEHAVREATGTLAALRRRL